MNRFLVLYATILGVLVCFPEALRASEADSLAAPDSVAVPDSPALHVERDTIQAGEFTVIGDVARPQQPGATSAEERERLKGELQMIGSREVAGLRQWQRKKNGKVAMLSSALLPGLGQLYNGRRIKAGLAAGFFAFYAGNAWLHWKDAQSWTNYRDNLPEDDVRNTRKANEFINFHKESSRDNLWWAGAVWVIGILDAWIDAHLYDLRVYTPPADLGSRSFYQRSPAAPLPERAVRYLTLTVGF